MLYILSIQTVYYVLQKGEIEGGGVCRKGNQVEHKMKTEGAES